MSAKLDLELTWEEEQEKSDGDENNHSQVCESVNLNFWFNTTFYSLTTKYSLQQSS